MNEELRKRGIVAAALEWTSGTAIAPDGYELWLLESYISGRTPLDQVIRLLEESPREVPVPSAEWTGTRGTQTMQRTVSDETAIKSI